MTEQTVTEQCIAVRIVEYQPSQVAGIIDQLTAIYIAVFSLPPYDEKPQVLSHFSDSIRAHLKRDGFLCLVVEDEKTGEELGFAYGYTSRPGQWWYDSVARDLTAEQIHVWFADCFELVDLALLPQIHGQGIGSRLHDALFQRVPHKTAALSTIRTPSPALHLYRRRGWQLLNRDLRFSGIMRPYMLLVNDLHNPT